MNSPFWLTFAVAIFVTLVYWLVNRDVPFSAILVRFFEFPFWAVLLIHLLVFIFTSLYNSYLFRLARTYWVRTPNRSTHPTLPVQAARHSRAPVATTTHHDITSASPLTPGRPAFTFSNV
jgi:hypothetical protein